MLVKPEDLRTELYPEILDAITRGDSNELVQQIKAAESFVQGYLFKYDLKALFGTETEEPTHPDDNLKKVVKTIAVYWLVKKANPNVNLDLYREDWELLIGTNKDPGWLTDIKQGRINPDWPYKPDDASTNPDESKEQSDVYFTSTRKRTQFF